MRGESSARPLPPSNLRGLKYEPKKIRPVDRRISFRDLARLAAPRKTVAFLVERLDCSPATAKRHLSGRSRVPGAAVYVVLADIFSRIE